jgi:AraC family transcriptional regulator, melibiose operon regulatory protein
MIDAEVLHEFDSRRRDFEPYGFTCEIWRPQQMPRPDQHDEIEINFLDRGTLTYLMGGQRVIVHPRRVTAFWAAVPHQIISFNKVNYYHVVTVPFGWFLQWGIPEHLLTALTQGRIVADTKGSRSGLDRQMFDQWHNDLEGPVKTHRDIVLLELRARMLRLADFVEELDDASHVIEDGAPSHQQTNLEKAESMACYIARNYTSRIQIKDVASCVALHPDYAATLFRKTFGTTLNSLITRHRISHAQRKLITSTERIVNIAHDSGFDSLSRFNRAFKEIAGVTPRQYRKSMGQVASPAAV